jgi:hypothetical protein
VSEKTTFDVQTNHFVKLFCCCFVKLIFSAEFRSVLFLASELALLRNSECLGMNAFCHGITETIPSLLRGIFQNEIPFQTLRKYQDPDPESDPNLDPLARGTDMQIISLQYFIERGSHSSQEKGERETKGESYRRWNSEPGADGERVYSHPSLTLA